jgi:hypothetical protein
MSSIKRRFSACMAAAVILTSAFAVLPGSARADEHRRGGERHDEHRDWHGGGWGHGDYRAPPVVYGSPYYAVPPLVYGSPFGLNINIR